MTYLPKNTNGKMIRGIPVMVEGLNINVKYAFQCAEIYIKKLEDTLYNKNKPLYGNWLAGIWFIKYRFQPLLIVYPDSHIPKKALEFFFSDEMQDEIQPKIWAMIVPDCFK